MAGWNENNVYLCTPTLTEMAACQSYNTSQIYPAAILDIIVLEN